MAQDCWSVVSVCATSYSWTTGPHQGAMESPQTAAGTRDPATPRFEDRASRACPASGTATIGAAALGVTASVPGGSSMPRGPTVGDKRHLS